MSTLSLERLPPPEVVETLDYAAILSDMKAYAISLDSGLEYALSLASEPATKILEALAYRELLVRQRINEAAKACMLAYSTGTNLDNLGALFYVERIDGEPDDKYRLRIRDALSAFSVAGPVQAYVFHTKGVEYSDGAEPPNVEIARDAHVVTDVPGTVKVYVLGDSVDETLSFDTTLYASGANKALAEWEATAGTTTASAELLANVQDALNSETVRPLNDTVSVLAAVPVTYDVVADVETEEGPDLSQLIATIQANLNALMVRQRASGRTVISRSAIHAAIHIDGVVDVDMSSPAADVELDDGEVALIQSIELTFPASS